MKLRTKISVIIIIIWAVMATLFYFGSQRVILNSYLQVENKSVNDNLERTKRTLYQVTHTVAALAKDWGIWDATFNFMQNKNKKYIQSNLTSGNFFNIGADMVMYFDTSGKLIYSRAVNKSRNKIISVPQDILNQLKPGSRLLDYSNNPSKTFGLIATSDQIYMIAAHPILPGDGKGDPRGKIVMVKYLTEATLKKVTDITKIPLQIIPIKKQKVPNDYKHIHQTLTNSSYIVIEKTNDTLTGYRFIKDINNHPIAILKIKTNRDIYNIGLSTITFSNVILFIYSLAILVFLWALLQFLVVKRIEKLSTNIGNFNDDKNGVSKLLEKVSDEVTAVQELYHQATHDPLTGLANRNLFYQTFEHYAEKASQNNTKIAVIFIDLDRFKRINDTLGHEVGDQILKRVAKRIKSVLKEDDIAARLGGDEFVVMLTNLEKGEIEEAANGLFKTVNIPLTHDEHNLYITASMGVCVYPDDGISIETMLKLADIALYHAKENGRNHLEFYSDSLSKTLSETHRQEIELQKAIDKNELCVYYQPIFDVKTKQLSSFEALIRWNHPEKGLLTGEHIIPIAERTALIHPIGEWLLDTVCMQIKSWLNAGLPAVPVAINFSSSQIRGQSLSENIAASLNKAHLDAHYVQIEITETGFIELTPKLLRELEELKRFGIYLSIDDFGTGYSGLGYLKKLPVSKLKIDKSFIRDIHIDADDKAIVLAVIAIAHQLNLIVIAEGVETQEQYDFLCHHNVDQAQGILLSPPLSAEEAEVLLSGSPKS